MINVLINGERVSYETLEEAQDAASAGAGLAFWRETLEACAADNDVWNDFLNELWQSGGEREAEGLDALFGEPSSRRWTLMALVLKGSVDPSFAAVFKAAVAGSFGGLIGWLEQRAKSIQDGDAACLIAEQRYWQGRQAQIEAAKAQAEAAAKAEAERRRREKMRYLVVDLSAGQSAKNYPIDYLEDVPVGGWTDEYKTTKLVLRRIEPGTFLMGSPSDESGRSGDETQHRVTLTKPYYMGVFAVTQKQWSYIVGGSPSYYNGAMRPVEEVSYNSIRGGSKGSRWPASSDVDADSFLGRLRTRTGCVGFDLPTEAQWEYACRAGTKGPYAGELDAMGWYDGNSGSQTHDVGKKDPNAWGLYDMHGNVWEWCLDWYGSSYGGDATDPKGAASGGNRVYRGGSWGNNASNCRSAKRSCSSPGYSNDFFGFRLCCSAGPAV